MGGARTALFCWLHARRAKDGVFIVRFEDTDRARHNPQAEEKISEALNWLGLSTDEGPFRQSERMDRYQQVITDLLSAGKAYRCYCTVEELDKMRAEARQRGVKPRYDGRCRRRSPSSADGQQPSVVRFCTPQEGSVVVDDIVQGKVTWSNEELDDLIIARSDGSPTYHLTVVTDDRDMQVTDVIRGDDHLNNTPRQVHIFHALGAQPPRYAHLPLILDADGRPMSKREGSFDVLSYRDAGYLPVAVINFLARLGWSDGDLELFDVDELMRRFDLRRINRAAAGFDKEKLRWCNKQHMRAMPMEELVRLWSGYLRQCGINPDGGTDLQQLAEVLLPRHATLVEMAEAARMFYHQPEIDEKAAKKHLRPEIAAPLETLCQHLDELSSWEAGNIHRLLEETAAAHELKIGAIAQPVRVAVCGVPVSPPIDVTLELLGKTVVLERLHAVLAAWRR